MLLYESRVCSVWRIFEHIGVRDNIIMAQIKLK